MPFARGATSGAHSSTFDNMSWMPCRTGDKSSLADDTCSDRSLTDLSKGHKWL